MFATLQARVALWFIFQPVDYLMIEIAGAAAVSFKWEEGSWLATGPYRRSRLCCQVFLLFVPLTVGALLIFILASEFHTFRSLRSATSRRTFRALYCSRRPVSV